MHTNVYTHAGTFPDEKTTSQTIFYLHPGHYCGCNFSASVVDLNFLYFNYPELKEKIPNSVIGTRIVGFLDPSFYYKFPANNVDADEIAGLLKLHRIDLDPISNQPFYSTGMFWHDWTWWHPNVAPTKALLYGANRDGNEIYLIFDFQEQVIYLYIQNT